MAFAENEFETPLPRYVRARDLIKAGIAGSYTALDRLIRNNDFPPGVRLSPNVRAWNVADVERWVATRPTTRKAAPPRKRDAEITITT